MQISIDSADIRGPLPRRRGALLLSLGLVAALGALAPRAAAQDVAAPSGALTGHFLVADGDLGGAVLLDVWAQLDWARVGGFVGAGAIPAERDDRNRVMMPFGISLAGNLATGELVTLQLRVRLGGWAGATQSEKLAGGVFAGGGAYVGFSIGHGALVLIGADAWAVVSSDAWRPRMTPDDPISASTWVITPALGLAWTPGDDREALEDEGEEL